MENQKKIEFYKYLRELFPNIKDTTLMLIVEDSLELINMENSEINFPLEFLEQPVECANDRKYNWNISTINHGRLQ